MTRYLAAAIDAVPLVAELLLFVAGGVVRAGRRG